MIKKSIRDRAIWILDVCASTPNVSPAEAEGSGGTAAVKLAVDALIASGPALAGGWTFYAEAAAKLRQGWSP